MATLAEVKKRIKSQGLDWDAGNTLIGKYFENRTFKGFGYVPKTKEPTGGRGSLSRQNFAFTDENPPDKVDWRAVESGNYVSGVRDQRDCGSCVAFATCAVLESRMKISRGDQFAFNGNHLSVSHLFYCGAGSNACDDGWIIGKALDFCRTNGVGNERDNRYDTINRACRQIDPAVKVKLWRKHINGAERKNAIYKRGPVIAGMHVFSDFGWYKGGIYRPTNTDVLGLHAVAVIGFDDEDGCWIVKNSWGTGWGEGGFARIAYGSCGIDTEFPFYDIELEICDTKL